MLFAFFKVKQRNIYSPALVDTGNLVHSAIVSWDFWESIKCRISHPMDQRVGTANKQGEGLQVVGMGESWEVYLVGMDEFYILEPLVIQGLSHSVNLGQAFLQEHNLKMTCIKEEVRLMPLQGGLTSRAGLRANKDQTISTQVRRNLLERISVNWVQERLCS